MMRPNLGLKMIAIAIGMVGTAGVAAAATVGSAPEAHVSIAPASIESDVLEQLAVDLGDTEIPDVTSLPTAVPTPTVPSLPPVPTLPSIPGAGALPFDPAALAVTADQAVAQVAALLPPPAALQAVVLECVSDLKALAPAPAPTLSGNPLGFLSGLLGSLSPGNTPSLPDPAAVQAVLTECVTNVLGVLPDPTALASALTTAFGPNIPAPIADLIAQLTGHLPAGAPDAGQLIDLVTNLVGASGSPAGLIDQLTGAIDNVVPAPLNELIGLPLGLVHDIFATIGLA